MPYTNVASNFRQAHLRHVHLLLLLLASNAVAAFRHKNEGRRQETFTGTHIATRVGHRLPLSILPAALRDTHPQTLTRHLYTMQTPHTLHAPTHDIRFEASATLHRQPPTAPTVTHDGRLQTARPSTVYRRRSVDGGYTLLHTGDGGIVQVRGEGLRLLPVYTDGEGCTSLLDVTIFQRRHFAHVEHEQRGRKHVDEMLKPPSPISSLASISPPATATATPPLVKCLEQKFVKVVEVAVVYDSTLCRQYSNADTADAAVIESIQSASKPYEHQSCVKLEVTHIDRRCNESTDPYLPLRNQRTLVNVLKGFAKEWRRKRKKVHRDVAVFFPGFNDRTGTAGIAWLGTACSNVNGYAVVEDVDDYVTAHEVGHLLNLGHTDNGIMRGTIPWVKDMTFSQFSIKMLSEFLDEEAQSKCITVERDESPPPSPSTSAMLSVSASPSQAPSNPPVISPLPSATISPVEPSPTGTSQMPSPLATPSSTTSLPPSSSLQASTTPFPKSPSPTPAMASPTPTLSPKLRTNPPLPSASKPPSTCETGFAVPKTRRGLSCHRERLGSVSGVGVWYIQQYGRLDIRLKTRGTRRFADGRNDTFALSEIGVLVSFWGEPKSRNRLWERRPFGNESVVEHVVEWPASRVETRRATCCFKDIYVHVEVAVEVTRTFLTGKVNRWKREGKTRFLTEIVCDFCSSSLRRMTPERRCPDCPFR